MRALLAATLLASLVHAGCTPPEEPLPELSRVPDFALVDQAGRPFTAAQLDGTVWVASFIFTHCPSTCPMLTSQMVNLQRRVADQELDARFVSFSVDPENDTPEVLRAYAATHGADLATWSFLTGESASVRRAVVEGMKVQMGEAQPLRDGPGYDILHATHFVLVDRDRRIRGYYATDRDGQDRLLRDIARLTGS